MTLRRKNANGTWDLVGAQEPPAYLKSGTVSDNTLTLTKKDNTTVTFSPTYTKADVGLGNVDNTTDLNKPISTATQTALDAKSTVSVAATGTATDTVQYITVDGTEKKLAGGSKVYYQTTEPTDAKEGDLWGNEEGGSGGGTVWGAITGTLSNQTDLQTTLDAKVPATRTVATIDLADDITVDELFDAMKSKFVDMLYPIGARYVQLQGMPEPSTFGGTWEIDATYNGKSLWVDSAQALGSSLAGSLPKIEGHIGSSSKKMAWPGAPSAPLTGAFSETNRGADDTAGLTVYNWGRTYELDFKASNSNDIYSASAGANVVRPTSMTCKVWKRTA